MKKWSLKSILLALFIASVAAPVFAQASQVADSLRDVERKSDQLMRNVQSYLQANGRWLPMPQGNDAALIMTLDSMKNQARNARRAAESNDAPKLMSQLSQLQIISNNAASVAHQAGMDGFTIGQLQVLQNTIQQCGMFVTMAPMVPATAYGYAQPMQPYGYQRQNPAYYQPNPGYYPPNSMYVPGVLQASSKGRGQFAMLGQVFMNIRNANLQSSDPYSKRAVFTISAGGDVINLLGTLIVQTPTSATVNVSSSDRGPASGVINGILGADGSLMSANGNGTLNGQAFVLSFKSN